MPTNEKIPGSRGNLATHSSLAQSAEPHAITRGVPSIDRHPQKMK
jgi:hypothetical protein